MPDILGPRARFGVLGPSTNTVVQPDFDDMRPVGVTNHYSRIFTPDSDAISNETFLSGVRLIGANTLDAVRSVMTSHPTALVMGMSAVTFFDGMEGANAFQASIAAAGEGVSVTIGSHALAAALGAYGGVRRVALLSPYFPAMNIEVRRYLGDAGFEVVRDIALQCPSWTAIAEITPARLRLALRELDGDDVDAIVQVGTNLSMTRLAAAAELWLGKPVIAINTATYWQALRTNGIPDKIAGFGRLLEDF